MLIPQPRIVKTVPYRPSKLRRFVVRTCIFLWLAATVIYTLLHVYPLIRRSHNPHVNEAHPHRSSIDSGPGHPR